MADIEFHHVWKRYAGPPGFRRQQKSQPLWKRWQTWNASKPEFWALRDVSFTVEHGEALGIIGHNGAGKTTLLKILSQITAPTDGKVVLRGNASSVIEISTGFHPELTGRENVYLSGVIFGMSRKEVGEKLPAIVEFSGVDAFIDVPVKRYSSGMYLRLAFAIAAHLEPDVLLLDEVLTVGDVAFQWKCLDRIEELRKAGRTIVLVSHDLAAIERLCDRALMFSRGQIVCEGLPRVVNAEYQQATLLSSASQNHAAGLSRVIECTHFSYGTGTGVEGSGFVRTGDPLCVKLNYTAHADVEDAVFNVCIYWPSGYLCTQLSTGEEGRSIEKGTGTIEFRCPLVSLRPGLYLVDIVVERPHELIDWQHRCACLRVDTGTSVPGDLYMPHESYLFSGDQQSPVSLAETEVILKRQPQ